MDCSDMCAARSTHIYHASTLRGAGAACVLGLQALPGGAACLHRASPPIGVTRLASVDGLAGAANLWIAQHGEAGGARASRHGADLQRPLDTPARK